MEESWFFFPDRYTAFTESEQRKKKAMKNSSSTPVNDITYYTGDSNIGHSFILLFSTDLIILIRQPGSVAYRPEIYARVP